MNKVLETILRKQAEIARYNYESLSLDNWINYTWTVTQEYDFKEWLEEYLYTLGIKDLEEIARFPRLVRKNKKMINKLANQFILQYGFKTKDL